MDIQDELPFDRNSITRCDNSSPSITGDELIEDWPHNKQKTKQVRISESAALRIYQNKDSYSQIKSYTSRERKEFGRNTIIEAAKIRKILSSMSDRSDHHRVMNHLGSRGVSTEEIVGIEQFVLLKAPHDVIKERRTHARSILLEKEKQRIMGLVDDERLALISSSTSKRAAVQARIRAGGAA